MIYLTFGACTGILSNKRITISLTRADRTEYESSDQQRSEAEWKFGTEMHSSERIRERLTEESLLYRRQVGQVDGSHAAT